MRRPVRLRRHSVVVPGAAMTLAGLAAATGLVATALVVTPLDPGQRLLPLLLGLVGSLAVLASVTRWAGFLVAAAVLVAAAEQPLLWRDAAAGVAVLAYVMLVDLSADLWRSAGRLPGSTVPGDTSLGLRSFPESDEEPVTRLGWSATWVVLRRWPGTWLPAAGVAVLATLVVAIAVGGNHRPGVGLVVVAPLLLLVGALAATGGGPSWRWLRRGRRAPPRVGPDDSRAGGR